MATDRARCSHKTLQVCSWDTIEGQVKRCLWSHVKCICNNECWVVTLQNKKMLLRLQPWPHHKTVVGYEWNILTSIGWIELGTYSHVPLQMHCKNERAIRTQVLSLWAFYWCWAKRMRAWEEKLKKRERKGKPLESGALASMIYNNLVQFFLVSCLHLFTSAIHIFFNHVLT